MKIPMTPQRAVAIGIGIFILVTFYSIFRTLSLSYTFRSNNPQIAEAPSSFQLEQSNFKKEYAEFKKSQEKLREQIPKEFFSSLKTLVPSKDNKNEPTTNYSQFNLENEFLSCSKRNAQACESLAEYFRSFGDVAEAYKYFRKSCFFSDPEEVIACLKAGDLLPWNEVAQEEVLCSLQIKKNCLILASYWLKTANKKNSGFTLLKNYCLNGDWDICITIDSDISPADIAGQETRCKQKNPIACRVLGALFYKKPKIAIQYLTEACLLDDFDSCEWAAYLFNSDTISKIFEECEKGAIPSCKFAVGIASRLQNPELVLKYGKIGCLGGVTTICDVMQSPNRLQRKN